MSVPLYELAAAALLGVGTTSSSIFGAALGLYVSFSRWILACILAFAAGALISALAIELGYEGAQVLHHSGLTPLAAWAFISAGFAALKVEYEKLHKTVLAIVRKDAVCRRLMTVPSVGPLVAITYKSAMDDPHRIAKSKAAGALFGLTPKKYQSGEKDVTGGITRAGDEMVRTALYEAANVLLARITGSRNSNVGEWTSPSGEVQNGRRSP
jgi:hypothetical protein